MTSKKNTVKKQEIAKLQELEKQISSLPEEQKLMLLQKETVAEYSGVLPPPSMLKQFDEVIPNGAERIMAMAEKEANEIIEVQTGTIVVEHEEEHHGHQEHHPLHHLHLVSLLTNHLVLLLAHGHDCIKHIGNTEQYASQTNMVANQPNMMSPLVDRVIGAQIFYPQEVFTTQLNGIGNKIKHRNPDGHLNEHRQASR